MNTEKFELSSNSTWNEKCRCGRHILCIVRVIDLNHTANQHKVIQKIIDTNAIAHIRNHSTRSILAFYIPQALIKSNQLQSNEIIGYEINIDTETEMKTSRSCKRYNFCFPLSTPAKLAIAHHSEQFNDLSHRSITNAIIKLIVNLHP